MMWTWCLTSCYFGGHHYIVFIFIISSHIFEVKVVQTSFVKETYLTVMSGQLLTKWVLFFIKNHHIFQFFVVGVSTSWLFCLFLWQSSECVYIPEQLVSVNMSPCSALVTAQRLVGNADSKGFAVNGYEHAFSRADAQAFLLCFCPQLITGVKEGMTPTAIWDYLRALWCANGSLITRRDNNCMETVEYQARFRLFVCNVSTWRNNSTLRFHRVMITCH